MSEYKQFITEPSRQIPVAAETDVLVAGAGIAGIAAALAAARHGKKVLLVEREFAVGGMATLGLITIYLPLCDGCGNQVVFGLGEELFHLSIKHGYEGMYNKAWLENGTKEERTETRFIMQFNPHLFALSAEELLVNSGVQILYGTVVADAVVKDGVIQTVIVENKSGRTAVNAKSVIDCTGDSDVCRAAGAPTVLKENGNGLASWYYFFDGSKINLNMFGLADVVPSKDEALDKSGESEKDNIALESLDTNFRFSGVDGYELSEAVLTGHKKMFEDILRKQKENKEFVPVTMSTVPLIRASRRLAGVATMEEADDHKVLPDSIGMTGDWCKRGPVYEIPFGALHCEAIRNLLVAGRNISTSDAMWNVTRVIPPAAVSGQAAGTAAALGSDFNELDIRLLQETLVKDGVKLHL